MTAPDKCPTELIELGHHLCEAVRPHIQHCFHTQIDIDIKEDGSPVTEADRGAEKIIRDILDKERPDDGILGEEYGEKQGSNAWRWILDPIDGTKPFITGKATFGTLIGLMHGDDFIMGFCDQAITKDRWVGAKGHPSTWNNRQISVRKNQPLEQWVTSCINPFRFPDNIQEKLQALYRKKTAFSMGGDCLNFCLMASGRIDVALEIRQQLYDLAALIPIVTGAGGQFLKYDGTPYTAGYTDTVIAVPDESYLDAFKGLS